MGPQRNPDYWRAAASQGSFSLSNVPCQVRPWRKLKKKYRAWDAASRRSTAPNGPAESADHGPLKRPAVGTGCRILARLMSSEGHLARWSTSPLRWPEED